MVVDYHGRFITVRVVLFGVCFMVFGGQRVGNWTEHWKIQFGEKRKSNRRMPDVHSAWKTEEGLLRQTV